MIHARDSFLMHLRSQISPTACPIHTDPEGQLPLNAVSVIFLADDVKVPMNPGLMTVTVSLDLLVEGTATQRARRRAVTLAMDINKALQGPWVKKQDWSDPSTPRDLGTSIFWRPWGGWKRIPEEDERYAHLNRTLSLFYIGESA